MRCRSEPPQRQQTLTECYASTGDAPCIYCLDPDATYREHVMPQAYGSFAPVNMILTEDGCHECNQLFGRKLETPGTRASAEGVHRLQTERMMSPESFLKMPKGRVRWESAEPDAQDVQLYHRLSEDGDVEAALIPQIIITYEHRRRNSFRPQDLTRGVLDGAKMYRPYADTPEALCQFLVPRPRRDDSVVPEDAPRI